MLAFGLLARAAVWIDPASGAGWDDRFHSRGVDESVAVIATDGANLYVAGDFDTAGESEAYHVARWDGTSWSPLGTGMAGISALVWDGSGLYAAGSFSTANGAPADHVARWDGATWSAVGGGLDHFALALAWDGTSLYAGGMFTAAGGVAATHVARWDGTSWSPLGAGIGGDVWTLVSTGAGLYAGGDFTTAGGVAANHVAHWDGASWSPLGAGTNEGLRALAWDGSSLYAGGFFTTAGGSAASRVARWDGGDWSALGAGVDDHVFALAFDGAGLYVGGYFRTAGGSPASGVARWDGTGWSSLGSGLDSDIAPGVEAMLWDGTALYVGGQISTAGGVVASGIARWSGGSWSTLLDEGEGLSSPAWCFARAGSSLYAGGLFGTAGDKAVNGIARWDGNRWAPLAAGVSPAPSALVWDGSGLFVGGSFDEAGGAPANNVARWDGTSWSPLGSGLPNLVRDLAWDGASLYAASGREVARWDGTSWSTVGGGMSSSVNALAWDGAGLYAGGYFTTAGGIPARRIARWDGTRWSALGTGIGDANGGTEVLALCWDGSGLYVGGRFGLAGGIPALNVARWDGTSWSALGAGISGNPVEAFSWDGTTLYAGGSFDHAGGAVARGLARWDGSRWSPLGDGVDNTVRALAWDGSGLFLGGFFTLAGNTPSARIARWSCARIDVSPPAIPPATTSTPYSVTFTAAGGAAPYTFAIASGTAPPGLVLSPQGVLSGSPTVAGVYPFSIAATDAEGCAGELDLVLLVSLPGCPSITIVPVLLPDAEVGVGYNQQLAASGGSAPHDFSLAGGQLPPGLSLGPSGAITGVPIASGTFVLTVAVVDASGCWGMRGYVLVSGSGNEGVVAGQGFGPLSLNRVRMFTASGSPTGTDFLAYAAGSWGTSVAAGDVGADPRRVDQALAGPGPGPVLGPHVRAFLRDGTPVAKVSYYAYGTLRFGVNPGTALLDGDAFDEILTGAGSGMVFGPHVRGWNHDGGTLSPMAKINYFAYGTLQYGVNVHRGDVDGDGFDELLTGPGPGPTFGAQVRGWNYDGSSLTPLARVNFHAFTAGYGVNLSGGNVDMDPFDEIACAAGPGPGSTPDFRAFDYDDATVAALPGFDITISTGSRYGGRVGFAELSGDSIQELLAGKGRDPGADARVGILDYATGALMPRPSFDAFPGLQYGVNPEGIDGGF